MKSWGTAITALYVLIVLVVLTPATLYLVGGRAVTLNDVGNAYRDPTPWILAVVVLVSEAALLWLSVDTSRQKLKPRTPVVLTAIMSGLLLMVVTLVIVLSVWVAVWGENSVPEPRGLLVIGAIFVVPWVLWGLIFYRMNRSSTDPVTRAVAWLFRGSVLELLVAVPSHVIVRRRHDCCAPGLTAFGITSGIAIMLMSFGPSVLLLYKKRIEQYSAKELVAK